MDRLQSNNVIFSRFCRPRNTAHGPPESILSRLNRSFLVGRLWAVERAFDLPTAGRLEEIGLVKIRHQLALRRLHFKTDACGGYAKTRHDGVID